MATKCDYCGKKPTTGNHYTKSGKPKYLGGNGVKVRGIAKRTFSPNLQKLQVQVGGSVERRKACVQCIRSGYVVRPTKRKPFQVGSI